MPAHVPRAVGTVRLNRPGAAAAPLARALATACARALALAVGSGVLVAVGSGGAAYAVDGDSCDSVEVDTTSENDVTEFAADGAPAKLLDLEEAQRRVLQLTGRRAGAGVTVAVLDSGVKPVPGRLTVQQGTPAPGASSTDDFVWFQGTMLAGVIASAPDPGTQLPVGIAPGATIYDQRIYDAATTEEGLSPLGPSAVADGLDAIAPLVARGDIDIVTVGVSNQDTPALRAAVERVTDNGGIIVAATAPRPDAESGEPGATYVNGEDFADVAFPAGYAPTNPLVLSVATTVADDELDPSSAILYSSAISVAAPTAGAVSLGLDDRFCSVVIPSTAVAAAEVSGVLAMLRTVFPDDRPEQLVARLEATASGSTSVDPAIPNTREGKGVVQPLEAVTRPLRPARDGTAPDTLPDQEGQRATLPVPDPDELASTRSNAVWWGLFAGGGLLVLVLLRPVLSRRRSS